MTFHVARDGQVIGEFSEAEFASKLRSLEIRSTDHYFVEGMSDWRPVYEYRPSVPMAATPTPEKVRLAREVVASAPPNGLPTSAISRERVYFDRSGVRVTNSRFLPGDQTFALSAINSVKLVKIQANQTATAILMGFAVVFGCLAVLLHPGWVVGALFFGTFGFVAWRHAKPLFAVVVSVSSGEGKALARNDEEFIVDVVAAINEAIIGRG